MLPLGPAPPELPLLLPLGDELLLGELMEDPLEPLELDDGSELVELAGRLDS